MEIEASLDGYCFSYETMVKEILEGIDEGFREGLREGIKKGFVAGICECRTAGFDNLDVKCLERILKDACETASDEAVCITIKQTVSNEYRAKIGPSFKQKMEEACNKAVEEIRDADLELDKRSASELKGCVDASAKTIKVCVGNACESMRKNFPADVVFGSFFDCLQDEFNKDLDKNLAVCEKRVSKEIDCKLGNKRVDHG
ncbi:hypothetical protein ACSAZK_03570 [Methanosarcina sp. Mfa9]|uniref:hypothetical protein n=1 Tax=Methanosarcina sp. Mfa9 TaxID=3439063 RepID=UPI003F834842